MTEKHTPGEWKPWKSPDGVWTVRAVYINEDGLRHTTWPAVCDAGAQDNEANARLIAQAPAMLEALREAEDHMILMYSGIAGGDAGAGQRFADKDPVVAVVRAVIAAATGETS